jgi:hypothetical protein
MIFNFTRRRVAFAALFICSAAAAVARAADKSDEDSTPVSVLIGDAVAEYDAGHFQEARALFRQAHEKSPTARTLRGIGMCSFELRDYVESARALAGSLRDQRRPLTSEQKRHAEALLARAHTFIGRFNVHVKPAGSSLFVDGHPADLEPDGVLLLPFGRHQLSMRCSTCSPAEKDEDVDVSGGEHKDIELALAPTPTTPTTGGETAAGTGAGAGSGAVGGAGAQPPGEHDTPADRGYAHLWLAGLAGAAAIGAGGAALLWRTEQNELDKCDSAIDAGKLCPARADIDGRRKLGLGMTIGFGAVAVGSAVFAAILWSRPDGKPEASSSSNVACAIGTMGTMGTMGKGSVSCAFRF